MKLITVILSAVIVGYKVHPLYHVSLRFGDRWSTLLRYGVGVVLCWPFVLLLGYLLGERQAGWIERITIAYFGASIAVGGGSTVGHLMERKQ